MNDITPLAASLYPQYNNGDCRGDLYDLYHDSLHPTRGWETWRGKTKMYEGRPSPSLTSFRHRQKRKIRRRIDPEHVRVTSHNKGGQSRVSPPRPLGQTPIVLRQRKQNKGRGFAHPMGPVLVLISQAGLGIESGI